MRGSVTDVFHIILFEFFSGFSFNVKHLLRGITLVKTIMRLWRRMRLKVFKSLKNQEIILLIFTTILKRHDNCGVKIFQSRLRVRTSGDFLWMKIWIRTFLKFKEIGIVNNWMIKFANSEWRLFEWINQHSVQKDVELRQAFKLKCWMERIARVKIASFQTIPCSRLDYVTLKRFLGG